MLCGFLPFDGDNNQEIFKSIIKCEPEFPDFLDEDSINLLLLLLNPNPKERISIKEIKKHPFYKKGQNLFTIQNEEIEEKEKRAKFRKYNSIDKKNIVFSTLKNKKSNIYTLNNIKKPKSKENKNFKINIYQNIFNNFINLNEEESNENKKNQKNVYLLTYNNQKSDNEDISIKNKVDINTLNAASIEINKFSSHKSFDKRKKNRNFLRTNKHIINNKFLNKNIRQFLKDKNIEKLKENIEAPNKLGFFQKFLLNIKKDKFSEKKKRKMKKEFCMIAKIIFILRIKFYYHKKKITLIL